MARPRHVEGNVRADDGEDLDSGVHQRPRDEWSASITQRDAIELWTPRLTRLAKGVGREWEDLLQLVWEQIFRCWDNVSSADAPLAYALRLAWHVKWSFVGRRATSRSREEFVDLEDDRRRTATMPACAELSASTPDRVAEDRELLALVERTLWSLPERDQKIYGFLLLGYGRREVAEIGQMKPHQVDTVRRRVEATLREAHRHWQRSRRSSGETK